MKKKAFLCAAAAGLMILTASAAGAATLTTEDGVLSIETPSDAWVQTQDPNYWFVISNGTDTIAIDHLSNGQSLPAVQVADNASPAVYQAFVSTKNEVFVIKGLAASQENLQSVMQTISSIKVLKTDTKTAVQQATPAPQVSQFGLRPINGTYYVTCSDLHVRSGYSTDDAILGDLGLGDAVTVVGAVTKGGQDYGWYQVQYNGATAYVSAGFLSADKPSETASSGSSQSSSDQKKINETTSSGNAKIAGASFTVTDNKGYTVATLTPYTDGYYYSGNGTAYVSHGNGAYSPVGDNDVMSIVYDGSYLDRLNEEDYFTGPDAGDYPAGDGVPVWNANGNYQGVLTPYSDGYYYSADGARYSNSGFGSYYGAGEVLYDYQGGGTAGSNYYDDEESTVIHDGYGGAIEIYPTGDQYGSYVDDMGNAYYQDDNGNWVSDSSDDNIVYWE